MILNARIFENLEIEPKIGVFESLSQWLVENPDIIASLPAAGILITRHKVSSSDEDENGEPIF